MTTKREAYLIVDIGTGNARVAVCTVDGEILGIKRENVQYESDHRYEDSIYFDPNTLWNQILRLAQQALVEAGDVQIKAVTATSQREGIVIIDKAGNSLLGMPNIDHRGRKWEKDLQDKDLVYNLSGRYPTSLFSAFKLVGVREVYPEIFEKIDSFMSISDWVQFQFSGVVGYEHSQASETLLYDVEKKGLVRCLVSTVRSFCSYFTPVERCILDPRDHYTRCGFHFIDQSRSCRCGRRRGHTARDLQYGSFGQ